MLTRLNRVTPIQLGRNMQSPTLETLLVNAGDRPLGSLPLALQALSLVSMIPVDHDTTARAHLEELRLNEPQILSYTIQDILQSGNPNIKNHRCSTVIMMVVMSIMALGYAAIQMYIAVMTKQLLNWQEMLIPILGPLMIVWYERGILRKENRDMLQALLGRAPLSVSEAATDYFTSRRRYPEPREDYDRVEYEDTESSVDNESRRKY